MNEDLFYKAVDLLVQGRNGAFLNDKEWRQLQVTLDSMAEILAQMSENLNVVYESHHSDLRVDSWGNIANTKQHPRTVR